MPHKNFEACLRVFATLKRRHNVPHTLVIVGAGTPQYVQSLHALAAELKIADCVIFSGNVAHDALPAWYAHAGAFILTSACESFGLPVIEAMAAGTPVVVSGLSGLPDTVGTAGVVCSPRIPTHLRANFIVSSRMKRFEKRYGSAASITRPHTRGIALRATRWT